MGNTRCYNANVPLMLGMLAFHMCVCVCMSQVSVQNSTSGEKPNMTYLWANVSNTNKVLEIYIQGFLDLCHRIVHCNIYFVHSEISLAIFSHGCKSES